MSDINSEKYWDDRFKDDWDENQGNKQSVFFADLALEMLPEWFFEHMRENKLSLCDWGCAEGDGTNVVADTLEDNPIEGIDFSETAIETANRRYKKKNLSFHAIDLLTKPSKKKYDVVFSSNVFEHFHNTWEVFETVSGYAEKLFVMMVPFNEDRKKLIPEHFHGFKSNEFHLTDDKWSIVHFSVKDTSQLPETYWGGQQAVIIFARNEYVKNLNLNFSEINLQADIQVKTESKLASLSDQLKEVKAHNSYLQDEVNKRDQEIGDLKNHVNTLWEHLHSRRFRLADSMYGKLTRLAPAKSIRRKVLRNSYYVASLVKKNSKARIDLATRHDLIKFKRKLEALVQEHKGPVIVYLSMPWENVMRQRPHHLAEQLANQGYLVVYIDEETTSPRILSQHLAIANGDWVFEIIEKRSNSERYFMLPAGHRKPLSEVEAILNKGFELIYEYIDELDETISGDIRIQKEVFDNLEGLKPALILASAKKLYDQLRRRFKNDTLLLNSNAVDVTHFDVGVERHAEDAPSDIKNILELGKPIVGYYGAMAPWLDYDMLNEIAAKRQDLSFVYIGVNYNGGLDKLKSLPNVFFLGPKSYLILPDYSYWFDCATIPFKHGDIAQSTSPVKLFEYMAMGIPTVCTRDLKECEGYKYVYMSSSAVEFESNIDKAIRAKNTQKAKLKLLDQAGKNTWQSRAEDIAEFLSSSRRLGS